jgi:hypothetical protein
VGEGVGCDGDSWGFVNERKSRGKWSDGMGVIAGDECKTKESYDKCIP